MRTIKESFDVILRIQNQLGYNMPNILNEPASNKDIEYAEKVLGFKFNDELIELLTCANGIKIDYNTPSGLTGLIPIYNFLSISDSIEYYNNHIGFDDSFITYSNYKPQSDLYPFLDDNAGNCYWIDLNKDTKDYNRIFWTNSFGEYPDYLFDSLTIMFQVISESYELGIINTDKQGYLDCDYKKFMELTNKYEK